MPTSLVSTGVQFPDSSIQTTSVPIGAVAIWSGAIASIPTGWQICNGTNGTPDLRDRFVVGAGSSYAMSATGGFTSTTLLGPNLPPHTHTTSASLEPAGSHSHTVTTGTDGSHTHPSNNAVYPGGPVVVESGAPANRLSQSGATMNAAGSHSHTVSFTSNSDHVHTISVAVDNTGGGTSHPNLPPYYALAYVMKIV
jgi:microcystin-dependent protein